MGGEILLLVLGFVLTSVAGGFLGFHFQKRTWDANRRESERQAAAALFDEVSRLMDRRLYRMWLVHWRLEPVRHPELLRSTMDEYRQVLREWNDSLNRNLALAYRYFGEGVWRYLDRVLYEEFRRLGSEISDQYRNWEDSGTAVPSPRLERELQSLSDDIYLFNQFMISLVQHGHVGLYQAPADWMETPPWARTLVRGSRGPLVAEWQRSLRLTGYPELVVDGQFGPALHEATVGFQRTNGLDGDGKVGKTTRNKMEAHLPPRSPTW